MPTDVDPFASAPAAPAQDEAQQQPEPEPAPEPAPAPAKKAASKPAAPVVAASSDKVTVTFKGGTGFDAPWIVFHAANLDDALEAVSADNAPKLIDLMTRVQNAGQHFSGLAPAKPASANGQNASAPRGATEAPSWAPPSPGAGWVYRTKVSPKTGKPWHAWMPPQGDDVSKPLFFNSP